MVHITGPAGSARVIEEHLGIIVAGILPAGRYSACKSYAKKHGGVLPAFCWSHARRDVIEAGKKYPHLEEWARAREDRINRLFHLNKLRTQYPAKSRQFAREEEGLHAAVKNMQVDIGKEPANTRLHHAQVKVLKSLRNHWEGLTVFLDHPHIPMDNNGSDTNSR